MNGLFGLTDVGALQCGPLSLLLSNIYLTCFGGELEGCGHVFVRYVDDCNVFVGSVCAGRRVMNSCRLFLEWELRLCVTVEKGGVGGPLEVKFLGFSFFLFVWWCGWDSYL